MIVIPTNAYDSIIDCHDCYWLSFDTATNIKFELGANRVIQVTFAKSMIVVPTLLKIVIWYHQKYRDMRRGSLACAGWEITSLTILLTILVPWILKFRGETRTLLVPSEMGYGERGVPNVRSFTFPFILTAWIFGSSFWPLWLFGISFSPQAFQISLWPNIWDWILTKIWD